MIDLYLHHKEGRFREEEGPHTGLPSQATPSKINLALIAVIIAAILMSAQWKPGISFFVAGVELRIQDLLRDVIFIIVTIWSLALAQKSDPGGQWILMGADPGGRDPVRRNFHLHRAGHGDATSWRTGTIRIPA